MSIFSRKRNIVFEDRERKILFVTKLDKYAMKMMSEGWTVEEVGELRLMTAEQDMPRPFGTLDRCSPPMGKDGRYVTATHCLELTPLFVECSENCSEGPQIRKIEVVEKIELVPMTWRCMFQDCTNYYDYGVVSRGIDYKMPDLVLSFGNATGRVAGFTQAPYYRGHSIGRTVRYVAYDYFDGKFVTVETRIIGYGDAYVYGSDNRLYKIRAYIAIDDKVIARPGYSGSGVFVVRHDNA
jgi:hypothetical protein